MNRRALGTLILLAVIAVSGILVTQVLWLNYVLNAQQTQADLRREQLSAESKQFADRVTIALSNVANEILTINNDPAKVFRAVSQVRPNYFTVAINDTVHPYLLENLLIREFDRRNIREDFEYGVYDCFTDSIVFGSFVALNDDSVSYSYTASPPQIKWDRDGHYFGVYFPSRPEISLPVTAPKITTWAFTSAILLIVFSFFTYSVWLILKQKRLSEIKSDFINNMTHELKTPISTIALSSQVLLKQGSGIDQERLHQYAGIIAKENLRLKTQVDKVLQLAAFDTRSPELKREVIDMHQLIEECLESFRLTLTNREGTLNVSLRAANPFVNGDRLHLTNIIHNLLDNANKYSPETPTITVTTENTNNTFTLSVQDCGIGLSKAEAAQVFEKFYRVPTGNRHDVKGFGLGLYYVREIAKLHGGGVSVQSESGKGSTFSVWLPLTSKA